MGFLYARFQKGSEFWEMHEVVRKCALMGLLIFLPPTSRAAVGILICVVCCCTLNYFQPHRNRLVLFVSQMSFLMSTFKYVCAVFLRINDLNEDDRKVMGWILVVLDVVFLLASVVAFVLVMVLLRAIGIDAHHSNALAKEDHGLAEGMVAPRPTSSVRVVPTPKQDEQQQRTLLKKEIVALQWQKNIRRTLMKNTVPKQSSKLGRIKSTRTRKVEEIERNHQNHRTMAVRYIKRRPTERRDSLQLRIQARHKIRNPGQGNGLETSEEVVGGGGGGGGGAATEVAKMKDRVDAIRLALCQTMTPVAFQKWMTHHDTASVGLVARVYLTKLVGKVIKKSGLKGVGENLMESMWVLVKKGGRTEVGWGVVEHEVLQRWVFGKNRGGC
jgi:hypothetical protein